MANYSDRFLGIKSGTKPPGNDPHAVLMHLHDDGAIPEAMLPFDEQLLKSVEEYYSYKGANENDCREEGLKFPFAFFHEYVWRWSDTPTQGERITKLKEALLYSPVCVAVTAWSLENGVYTDNGVQNNHWVVCYKIDDKGIHVFDSYAPHLKTLALSHKIGMAKRFHLEPSNVLQQVSLLQSSWYNKVMKTFFKALWEILRGWFEPEVYVPVEAPKPPEPPKPVVHDDGWRGGPLQERLAMYDLAEKVCKEEGLSVAQTQDLLATIMGESGFNPHCVNHQSKDYGIAQFSARYYLVEYKMTPQEAIDQPERCLKIMAKNWRTRKSNWVAYSSGGYKQWLGKKPK